MAKLTAIEQIKFAADDVDTRTILESIRQIGGGTPVGINRDSRVVRAGLIEVIAEREGVDAADAIMDEIGM